MKKFISTVLAIVAVFVCLFSNIVQVSAVQSSTIAVVFDNSGSMYVKGEQAWCRATYAMEVFASMMNEKDVLTIHPMNPIEVNGKTYTMDSPFKIDDPSKASQIRNIYTAKAGDTHIETIDAAVNSLKAAPADSKKTLIVLTDGQVFYEDGLELSVSETKKRLSERFSQNVGPDLNILYLGIGADVAMPGVNSEYYMGKKASDSSNVLSTLTMMCNTIFARDTLPSSHISGKTIDFDISLKKLIVFVQGENVSDVKVTGKNGAKISQGNATKVQYSEKGAGNYQREGQSAVDKSLQGMLVTYTNCSSGQYDISYSGNASNIEVYYEPDADMVFLFTDDEGNLVDPEALYKGDYKVQFGLKDKQTGELITSDLIGDPVYEGKYVVNGKETAISHSGKSGETPVSLDMGDTFSAELTASYLSGYSIRKTAKDFGWPEGSLTVAAKPAGDLVLEITGGDEYYELATLEDSGAFTAKVYYQGNLLTGDELAKVDLKWHPEKSNAEIKKDLKDDHYDLNLFYKDPKNPADTRCGKCTVVIYAHYQVDGAAESVGQDYLTYTIKDNVATPKITFDAEQKHYQISKIDEGDSIFATITTNGKKLSENEFNKLEVDIDCGGIGHKVIPHPEDSCYEIKLDSTGRLEKGDYDITVSVKQKDALGRDLSAEKSLEITLSPLPLWLEWLIIILAILIIIFLAYFIAHRRRLPSKLHTNKKDCEMNISGEDETKNTVFNAAIDSNTLVIEAKFANTKTGVKMDVEPGTDSFLKTKQVKRKVRVKAASVKKFGGATIDEVSIGNKQYLLNNETGRLEPVVATKDFDLSHGNNITIVGTMLDGGVEQPFYAKVKLNYKKK